MIGLLSQWRTAPPTPPPPPPVGYLTFSSGSSFSLRTENNAKNWDGVLEYSTDATTWSTWNGTLINSVNNKLYVRGTSNTYITGYGPVNYSWTLTGTNIACIGNIETLLDYEDVLNDIHPPMANYCYQSMFLLCTSLTTAPELPALTLASHCYNNMFYGCTSLTTAPELPATTLANYCYWNMFAGCVLLTTPPDLPATTMANSCYYYMFENCTSLKVSSTMTGEYTKPWRLPTTGTGSTAANWNRYMLDGTGGTFTGYPSINTTYYTT